jgi:stage III sporulation protein AE
MLKTNWARVILLLLILSASSLLGAITVHAQTESNLANSNGQYSDTSSMDSSSSTISSNDQDSNLTSENATDPATDPSAFNQAAGQSNSSNYQKNQQNNIENQSLNAASQHIDTSKVDKFWRDLHEKYGSYLPGQDDVFQSSLPGHQGFSLKGVITGGLKFLFHELWSDSKLLGTILILGVIAALLTSMQAAFESNVVSTIAYSVCYLVLIVLAVTSFNKAIEYGKDAIITMVDFMLAMVPLTLTLLASVGGITSAALFHPLMTFVVNVTSTVVLYIVFPLLFFSALLTIVSGLSEKFKVTNLANLARNVSFGILGIMFTFFLGVIAVQGTIGAVSDGITLKAAKFLASNFIPVLGKMFSDAAETVIGASLLVKNAVGIGGVIIVLLICAFPAIQILSLSLIYNFASALIQPLGDSPIVTCLSHIGKSMTMVFAALATVGLMFFISITMIIAASNLAVMMR